MADAPPAMVAAARNNVIFPSAGLQILSSLIHFLGASILSHCLSRRLTMEHLTSFSAIRELSWPRLCIILVFLTSWLFLVTSGILIFGAGMELNSVSCSLGIDFCIAFYATSKIFIYFFLTEKVYLVWAPLSRGHGRFKSPVFLMCFVSMCLYSVVVVVIVVGKISFFRSDGRCVIGLQHYASVTLLSYDLFINVFLTSLFLWPLLHSRVVKPTVRRLASRTLLAAVVALVTSSVNMLVLTLMHGQQLGWVCIGSCGTDVILNALILFWVTGGGSSRSDIVSLSGGQRITPNTAGVPLTSQMNNRPAMSPMSPTTPISAIDAALIKNDKPSRLAFMPREIVVGSSPSTNALLDEQRTGGRRPSRQQQPRTWATSNNRSIFGALSNLFRKSTPAQETTLQITITTIREMDTIHDDYTHHSQLHEMPLPKDNSGG
ncbi:hypothetical protein JAAARDRAFT_59236 [Jaapia argillacea MUCL 33604]|uniref:Transmembrane protein n=1 Tax=Jaapia argillacea MUCL 33604 TaxID=933084 RepID=A0A067PRA4_9AGAM|nr:hypothetical protein JAAARDRAFT_59236 [Jaapia argillacea MUCL 33604]